MVKTCGSNGTTRQHRDAHGRYAKPHHSRRWHDAAFHVSFVICVAALMLGWWLLAMGL